MQVDNGTIMRANITPITLPGVARVIFTGWGVAATAGAHVVTVKAFYWEGQPTETAEIPIAAQGAVE